MFWTCLYATVLSSLRSTLSSIALLHPDVAFSLTDTTSSPSSLSSEPRALLSVGRSSTGLVGRWKQLWGCAGVEHVVEFDEVEPAAAGKDGARMRARGFFSLSAAHSKSGQHVFVNSRNLAPATSPLHKLLNTLFASSSFARHASSHLSFPASSPASSPARAAAAVSRGKSPKKVAERHPVFVVVLDVPGRVVDVSLEPEKRVVEFEDLSRVEAFVSLIARRFLTSQGFLSSLPPSAPAPSRPPASSPARHQPLKRPRSASPTVSANIESVRPPKRLASSVAAAARVAPTSSPLRTRSATLPPQQSPSAGPTAHPLGAGARDEYAEKVGGPQRWVDPATREVWDIDTRTGNSWRAGGRRGQQEGGQGECVGCEKGGRVDRRALRTSEGMEEGEDMPGWLQKSLEKWQNPIFPAPPVNSDIPTLPSLVPGDGASTHVAAVPLKKRSSRSTPSSSAPLTRSAHKAMSTFFSTASATTLLSEPAVPDLPRLSRLGTPAPSASPAPLAASPAPLGASQQTLSRASLQHSAEYLAQVDAKYLVVKLASTLVLVDQHAASERIRVESFLASLVGRVARGEPPDVRRLARDARIGVVVGRAEARAVRERWSAEFARWGLELEFDDRNEPSQAGGGGEEGEYHQLWLATVPALLHARLSTEPRTAQALVRSFVAQLEEHSPLPPPPQRSEAGDWVAALRGAPPVLKELLDSKACRGAIMFNDVLSPEQGQALVSQLAQTRFPFQCAHGRPSLVPVVNLANDDAARRARWDEVDWSRFD
ncbi:hypothetical protein Rhopal_004671-T1 [Rhodotorula paludigena]|uniref:MutL C-terminal dimerisation domain-containing protein n=1 Tax=Rhodotorula paludigena TaxID=86838 RepID=A0AAV5GN80_9BASI|nr:hypothetical protein Rhopal_004671-T1 [Rhodotorula paludigena]